MRSESSESLDPGAGCDLNPVVSPGSGCDLDPVSHWLSGSRVSVLF